LSEYCLIIVQQGASGKWGLQEIFPMNTSAIAIGAHVRLFGLLNESYNSQEGIYYGENNNGRHIIQLDSSQKRILVKRENIQVIIPRSSYGPMDGFTSDPTRIESIGLPSSNSSWAKGLDPMAAAEWFIDCYRMRLDDEYVYRGDLRGLYDPESTKQSIASDFLVYCHMALFVGAVPLDNGWDWVGCLDKFGHLLNFAFEKSDAGDKYGRENIFSAMMGGRSLRFTAELIYGSGIGGYNDSPMNDTEAELERLQSLVARKIKWKSNNILFKNVGGFDVWKRLLDKLKS
jgi:hypothetical protein